VLCLPPYTPDIYESAYNVSLDTLGWELELLRENGTSG
jgi:hypothetical protein